jgi:hypothetical protein
VIDHQIDRHQRVDPFCVAAELDDAIAHRRQIDHGGDAGEILHQDARGAKWYIGFGMFFADPIDDGFGVLDGGAFAVFKAQHVFQQNFQGARQAANIAELGSRLGERKITVGAGAYLQIPFCFQTILTDHAHSGNPFSRGSTQHPDGCT